MGELSIRRNWEISTPKFQKMSKTEKRASVGRPQSADSQKAAATVSQTLRELAGRLTRAGRQVLEGRRTLQSGEASLAEVEESLGRMEELARQSAQEGAVDRDALQAQLDQLRGEIDRIARAGIKAGLFQDGEAAQGLDALVDAIMEGLSARQEGVASLPAWLLRGMASEPSREALLEELGLDGGASGAVLAAALGRLPLESSQASGYLAAVYLGTVISGGMPSGEVDLEQAADGLRQFLEAVAQGASPDEAMEQLTGGIFTSMEDFQTQFLAGTAPGLEAFLSQMLAGEGGMEEMLASILNLLAGTGGGEELELLLALLDGSGGGDGLMALLEGADAALEADPASAMQTLDFGAVQVSGRDLSGVSFDPENGTVTVGGSQDVVLRGQVQEAGLQGREQSQVQGQESSQAMSQGPQGVEVRLTGSGTVTLQHMDVSLLKVESPEARLAGAGENTVALLQMEKGAVLTMEGGGRLHLAGLRADGSNTLRFSGGTVELGQQAQTVATAVRLVMDGPASLLASEGLLVRDGQGKPMTPFDILWKTLLPEWDQLASLEVNGQKSQMILLRGDQEDLIRLWLLGRGAVPEEPVQNVKLKGRDRAGRTSTQQLYVRWDEESGSFQETPMYPNPFTVTGGEQDVDWSYEEDSQTLHILTREVTAISGGPGVDTNEQPFSGRIALADKIGGIQLTLEGVECRVSSGRAFYLGRANRVTLLLRRGTVNVFESGAGCAGISLGDGTSLCIDQTKEDKGAPDGVLNATGAGGGAGIGRDSGAGQENAGSILIRDGVVTATGAGGGAGIGGALGGPVGDIRIQGGTVTAQAACSAAAIGAGIQGSCGDILITGTAKVVKAQGGGPDGDIGGCLFGNCGRVQVSPGTDIGAAKLWTHQGLTMQVGEGSVTLPKFRVSARALGLDGLDISSRTAAKAAMSLLTADRRWVGRLQGAYGAMYGQLAQSFSGMYSVHRHFSVLRDTDEASSLVTDIREVLRQSPRAKFLAQRGMEDVGYLLRP